MSTVISLFIPQQSNSVIRKSDQDQVEDPKFLYYFIRYLRLCPPTQSTGRKTSFLHPPSFIAGRTFPWYRWIREKCGLTSKAEH